MVTPWLNPGRQTPLIRDSRVPVYGALAGPIPRSRRVIRDLACVPFGRIWVRLALKGAVRLLFVAALVGMVDPHLDVPAPWTQLRSGARRSGRPRHPRGTRAGLATTGRPHRRLAGLNSSFDAMVGLVDAYVAYTQALQASGGVNVRRSPDLCLGVTPIDLHVLNRVMLPRLRTSRVQTRVAEVIEQFDRAGVSSSWWLDAGSTPSHLPEILQRAGYSRLSDSTLAMQLDLRHLPPMVPVDRTELINVAGPAEMVDAQTLSFRGFGVPAHKARERASLLAPLGDPETGVRTIVARLDNQPVAVATAVLTGTVVGLYSISTLPVARRKGLGRAVTVAVLHDAASRGARHAVLESSPAGLPIYEEIGFRGVGTFRILDRPAGGPSIMHRAKRRLRGS